MRYDPNAMDGRWALLAEGKQLDEDSRWYELRDGQVWTTPYSQPIGAYELDGWQVQISIALPGTDESPAYSFRVTGAGLIGSGGHRAAISAMTATLAARLTDEAADVRYALIREGLMSDALLATNIQAGEIVGRIARDAKARVPAEATTA